MIRHIGRSSARGKVMQERRRYKDVVTEIEATAGRIIGRCSLCGSYHVAFKARTTCAVCGGESCWTGCTTCEGNHG